MKEVRMAEVPKKVNFARNSNVFNIAYLAYLCIST